MLMVSMSKSDRILTSFQIDQSEQCIEQHVWHENIFKSSTPGQKQNSNLPNTCLLLEFLNKRQTRKQNVNYTTQIQQKQCQSHHVFLSKVLAVHHGEKFKECSSCSWLALKYSLNFQHASHCNLWHTGKTQISLLQSLQVQKTAISDFKLVHLAMIVIQVLYEKVFFVSVSQLACTEAIFQSKFKIWQVIKEVSQQLLTLTLNALLNPLAKKPPNGAINELKSERTME